MTTQFLDRQSTLKQIEFFLPQIGETIKFPAFLDSISDNFTANWDSKQYYGVQDSIGHFVGTSRKIDCSFKIMAQKENESIDYQVQLNKLVQSLYPRFNSKTVPKSSPIIGVKFENVIRDNSYNGFLYGWLDGINLAPNISESGYGETAAGYVAFYSWTLSFSLNVIHVNRPGFKNNGFTLGNAATFPVAVPDRVSRPPLYDNEEILPSGDPPAQPPNVAPGARRTVGHA